MKRATKQPKRKASQREPRVKEPIPPGLGAGLYDDPEDSPPHGQWFGPGRNVYQVTAKDIAAACQDARGKIFPRGLDRVSVVVFLGDKSDEAEVARFGIVGAEGTAERLCGVLGKPLEHFQAMAFAYASDYLTWDDRVEAAIAKQGKAVKP